MFKMWLLTLGKSMVGSEIVSVPFCLDIRNTCNALATDMNASTALERDQREETRDFSNNRGLDLRSIRTELDVGGMVQVNVPATIPSDTCRMQ